MYKIYVLCIKHDFIDFGGGGSILGQKGPKTPKMAKMAKNGHFWAKFGRNPPLKNPIFPPRVRRWGVCRK